MSEEVLSNRVFAITLTILCGAFLWLAALLGDFGARPSTPIGGGGYDLSKPVYSASILLLTALWSLTALIMALASREGRTLRQALILGGLGVAGFVASILLYGHNLH